MMKFLSTQFSVSRLLELSLNQYVLPDLLNGPPSSFHNCRELSSYKGSLIQQC